MGVVVSFFSDENVTADATAKDTKLETFKKPKFYKGREGPSFVLLDYNELYETRKYERMFWISVLSENGVSNGNNITLAAKESCMKMKTYFRGCNSRGIRMSETCPLFCKVTDATEVVFSMVLPEEHFQNPPSPMTNDLFLEEQATRMFYAVEFKGCLKEEDMRRTVETATEGLQYNGERFASEFYYLAFYGDDFRDGKGYKEILLAGDKVEQEYICLLSDDD